MTDGSNFGRILTYIGTISALLPQVLDLANMLPDAVKQSKYVQLTLAAVGGMLALLGVLKETASRVAYINGRSLLKAAAIRDVSPDTAVASAVTVTADDAPKV
jgi:hypothetical protein